MSLFYMFERVPTGFFLNLKLYIGNGRDWFNEINLCRVKAFRVELMPCYE